jgi:hypothetical protein
MRVLYVVRGGIEICGRLRCLHHENMYGKCIAPISSPLDEIFRLLHAPTTLPQERTKVLRIQ